MIFLHGLALAVYEYQRYLKHREDQRVEMLKREADLQAAKVYAAEQKLLIADPMEAKRSVVAAAVEKAEAATAAADAGYAAWKEALIFAALEAERVSAYSKENAGTPATLEVKRLEAVALEKAHSYAALEQERAAAAVAMERVQAAAVLGEERVAAAAVADMANDDDAAGAVAGSKADTLPDQRVEMLKREADLQAAKAYAAQQKLLIADAMEAKRSAVAAAVEKAEAATAAADAGYAAWKEALIFVALEAERVSAYSKENAGTPATLEVKRLEAVALEKAHSYAALEQERAAAAVAVERVQAAAALGEERVVAAAVADMANDDDAAGADAGSKADTLPGEQDKNKKGIGGMKSGFML